jgi:SAM-dependent methyltransferase
MSQPEERTTRDGAARYYTDGSYWAHRKDSDSSYKVRLVLSLLESSGIELSRHFRAVEVGCGQGAFLVPLAHALRERGFAPELLGLDISAKAIEMANARTEGIDFAVGSATEVPSELDLIFLMDVVEHVDQPYDFIRSLACKSRYLVIHLPIEHSIAHLLLRKPTTSHAEFHHIHFYSWETAQLLVAELPFRLVSRQFSAASMETVDLARGFSRRALLLARLVIYRLAPRFAPTLAGGSVLLLLENDN